MKNVAILTKFYKNYNYGGMLQGYALYKAIINLGANCKIVSYSESGNPGAIYRNKIEQAEQYSLPEILAKINEVASKRFHSIDTVLIDRKKRFDDFSKKVELTDKVYSDRNLYELNTKFDVFISGSDQIWNPNAVRELYLQKYVTQNKTKASYAASFGRDNLNDKESRILMPAINKLNFIGVREKSAANLINRYLPNKKIEVVLDPTLLFDAMFWDKIRSEVPYWIYDSRKNMNAPRYALFYFFSDSLGLRMKLHEFLEQNNLSLALIPYAKQIYKKHDMDDDAVRLLNVGPCEFVNAISNANIVFTDSFHGLVFSIIFHKQFYVFKRDKENKNSTNSRITDLCDTLKLNRRIISKDETYKIDINDKIDYEQVDKILNEKREESIRFLQGIINYD